MTLITTNRNLIIKPPHEIKEEYSYKKSVFLAGSIEMGKAENWQSRLEKDLEGNDLIIYNPRRDDWDSSWKQDISNPQFKEQVKWELQALEDSAIIAMYFDPSTKSPISLLELGLHARSCKLYVCCPEGFWRRGNVEVVCEWYQIPFYSNYEEWVKGITKEFKYK